MRTYLKITGLVVFSLLVLVYLAFLFILPRSVDLNSYKSELQKIVLEQANLKLDFSKIKILTTASLEAGLQINDLNVKLYDNSDLISADRIRVKISLPSILLLTLKISEIRIDNPNINVEIAKDGAQYKVVQIIEDILNEQKNKQELIPDNNSVSFNPELIKIKVPNINVFDYSVIVNDLKTKHNLVLRGRDLHAHYEHMKNVRIKTKVQLLSDTNENVNADIDVDTFIPPVTKLDKDDDTNYRVVVGFVNPVLMYRDYDLKTNIFAHLKIRQDNHGGMKIDGATNIEKITLNLSGYKLPESYFRAKFNGQHANVDTNLYITPLQNVFIYGTVNYSKKPKLNICINTQNIYFRDVLTLVKSFMDSMHIKNDLAKVKVSGYLVANAHIKTNFRKMCSNGGIVIRNGNISNEDFNIQNINLNLVFLDKVLKIFNTHLYVNNAILKVEGTIDDKSNADISIFAERLPLKGLFNALAPVDIKKIINVNSGDLFIDFKFTGQLKKAIAKLRIVLTNLNVVTSDKTAEVLNDKLAIDYTSNLKTLTASIVNNGFKLNLIPSKSIIVNDRFSITANDENIIVSPFVININKSTIINIAGEVLKYSTKALMNFKVDGNLYALDLKQILGPEMAPFVDAKGVIPLKINCSGNGKRQSVRVQLKADANNYLTPLHIGLLQNKQTIFQALINLKGSRLNIRNTGLFVSPVEFGNDFDSNLVDAQQISELSGTITGIDGSKPYINLLKIVLPDDISANIHAFKNSSLHYGGHIFVFGFASSPRFIGNLKLWDLSIPELYTTLKKLNLKFASKTLNLKIEDMLLNDSDIQVDLDAKLAPSDVFNISNLLVTSNNFDVTKLMKVVDAAMKYVPAQSTTTNTNKNEILPVAINGGQINFRRILVSPIVLENTISDISFSKNIFYLSNIKTATIGGRVIGDVSLNVLSIFVRAKLHGENFDVERCLYELLNMKDIMSGIASFYTDISLNGAATNQMEQMKSILGTINFVIKDGQVGPFGRLENLILAENIRESEFFKTALGGVINSLTSFDTSHFTLINGHIDIKNGIVKLEPITSVGPVMCLRITGDMNLLNNQADMKLRARLGSQLANMLGPIAAVNPINLLKATPGMNVAAAKMFALFCEEVTKREMDEIPQFEKNFNDMSTTNFQIIIKGDTQKPLSLIKSFKWLATVEDINAARNFVDTLPSPDVNNPNATLEELMIAQAEAERLAKQNKFQKFITKLKKKFTGKNKGNKQ